MTLTALCTFDNVYANMHFSISFDKHLSSSYIMSRSLASEPYEKCDFKTVRKEASLHVSLQRDFELDL